MSLVSLRVFAPLAVTLNFLCSSLRFALRCACRPARRFALRSAFRSACRSACRPALCSAFRSALLLLRLLALFLGLSADWLFALNFLSVSRLCWTAGHEGQLVGPVCAQGDRPWVVSLRWVSGWSTFYPCFCCFSLCFLSSQISILSVLYFLGWRPRKWLFSGHARTCPPTTLR